MPAEAWWDAIHQRLLHSDPTAPSELAETVLDLLQGHLRAAFPRVRDKEWINDAAEDALVSYLKKPSQFQPQRNKRLWGYLQMSAEGDLLNRLAKEKRRKKRERRDRSVEVSILAGNEPIPVDVLSVTDTTGNMEKTLARLFPHALDRAVATLVIQKERSTDRFACIIGITDRPKSEQRKTVKQYKDRIKKVLQRRGRIEHG
jgi:DNA-directed RNA polymerase specialized sigma24 family protein